MYVLLHSLLHNNAIRMNSSSSEQNDKRQGNSIMWSAAFGAVDVVILIGNVITLIVFSTNKRLLRTRANYFLINLAMADMMVGIFAIPMYLYHMIAAWYNGDSIWQQYSYKIYKVVDVFVGCASIFTLTVIALERAFSVCSPHIHRHFSNTVYYMLLGLIWLLSTLMSCLRFLFEEQLLSLQFFFYFLLAFFAISISIICISYVAIWFRMKFRFARRDSNKRSSEQDRRLAVMLFTVTVVFAFSWMPFQIINIVTFFCEPCRKMPYGVAYFTKFLHYGNSCVNPIIYSFLVPNFRRAAFRIIRKLKCR